MKALQDVFVCERERVCVFVCETAYIYVGLYTLCGCLKCSSVFFLFLHTLIYSQKSWRGSVYSHPNLRSTIHGPFLRSSLCAHLCFSGETLSLTVLLVDIGVGWNWTRFVSVVSLYTVLVSFLGAYFLFWAHLKHVAGILTRKKDIF